MSPTNPVTLNFSLDIVIEMAITLDLVSNHGSELCCEFLKVVQMVNTKTRAGSLGRVGRANAFTGSTNATTAKFSFLQAVNALMEIEDKMGSVRDEKTSISIETLNQRE